MVSSLWMPREKDLARDCWQPACVGLEKLSLPYLTIDLNEMINMFGPESLDEDVDVGVGAPGHYLPTGDFP